MVGYRILADGVVLVHLAWAVFIVAGLVLILVGAVRRWAWVRNFWFRMVHLTMIAIVAAEAVGGLPCPLTTWENRLRQAAGDVSYPGSFIGRWANRVLFCETADWVLDVVHILFFGLVVVALMVARPRWPFRSRAEADGESGGVSSPIDGESPKSAGGPQANARRR